ncbi:S8 family serine peptidase [Krasilnikoviella flava]|uniref:Serine protease, subtilisin family n=1 Tax=Krasilnikoviella flava TaxID=526729 RepID=A0A1T5ISF8_9MICO|nr:S8 family serine peptidase [Krasilnikoviella flava]SKC42042.1 Serine protease, subtilisin family [Krasilnikoviella flava]
MHLPRRTRRRHAVWAAASLTAVALLASPLSATADPDPTAGDSPKVDTALASAVKGGKDATFFVVLKDQADLAAPRAKKSHAARAKATYTELKSHAETSQRSLTAFLDAQKVGHQDYWIANTVQVTGDADLVAQLAERSDVATIVKERTYQLDSTVSAVGVADTTEADGAPEWGVADINADDVWTSYEDRGEGIVIANVDSGVQYDHPDLVGSYRGNNGDGTFTNDYNFYDATGTCTDGAPCDNNGHGTHTMGTMVAENGIGVAPNATWIAAKGCEARECSEESLLKAGQWILAPTDANGENPRPELAPNIVNNSWGGGYTTFYADTIAAWDAAGIFATFSAGNSGDGVTCSTAEAPGAQASVYGVGAYDATGTIAGFSGFGPSLIDGSAVPSITAPGVDVRSTWPGSEYNTISGTSMAAPHVAGSVALLWSAAPSLIGDIAGTREALAAGARDVDDTHCGGTVDANNVWGEGKLDILASVDQAPHTAATVTGTVTDETTGAALPNVVVTVTNATTGTRTVTTGSRGTYRIALLPGTYDFAFSGYGYGTATVADVELADGQELTQDVTLAATAAHPVTGSVLDVAGAPLAGATVEVTGTPVEAVTTATDGSFTLPAVAEGDYTLTVSPAEPVLCNGVSRSDLTVDGVETRTVRLPARTDASGTSCVPAAYSWVKGTDTVALSGDEDAATIALPFWVSLYGVDYSSASVTTNGLINVLGPRLGDYENTALPEAGAPNGIVAPFWDDLTLDKRSSVQTATKGKAGKRTFAVVWNKAKLASDGSRVTFEVLFDEATGDVTFQYQSVPDGGASATVGLENQAGSDALQYSFDQPVLAAGSAIRFAQGD